MLAEKLIFPVDEVKCVSLIFIQNNKDTEGIQVYMNFYSLSNACFNDPFPTLLSGEVLNNVAGNKSYSFPDGFSGHHQVQIVEEDKKKTTFTTECGSYAYHVMPFELKNFQQDYQEL